MMSPAERVAELEQALQEEQARAEYFRIGGIELEDRWQEWQAATDRKLDAQKSRIVALAADLVTKSTRTAELKRELNTKDVRIEHLESEAVELEKDLEEQLAKLDAEKAARITAEERLEKKRQDLEEQTKNLQAQHAADHMLNAERSADRKAKAAKQHCLELRERDALHAKVLKERDDAHLELRERDALHAKALKERDDAHAQHIACLQSEKAQLEKEACEKGRLHGVLYETLSTISNLVPKDETVDIDMH